ncbi:MAG: cob(I)yrinic acid a,c-diamide adenosyltransferase [Anaerolineales bacterium]|nr:MAG: cob(I)yrinic acid a,c-diamide adenosyltransferase [Anaerolineales bacterium]
MPTFFTRSGDDGYTELLGGERVPKYHLRPAAYGTLDEALAALGFARSLAISDQTKRLIEELQRDLYKIMAEVAAVPDAVDQFRSVDAERLTWLEAQIDSMGKQVDLPHEFVMPGDSASGGALDLARTIVRRGERMIAQLQHEGELENPQILPYINRLSSLCFILALWENDQAGIDSPSLAKTSSP